MTKINQTLQYFKENSLSLVWGIVFIILVIWNKAIGQRLSQSIEDLHNTSALFFIRFNMIFLIIITVQIRLYKQKEQGKFIKYILEHLLINKLMTYLSLISNAVNPSLKTLYQLFFNNSNISHILQIPFFKFTKFLMKLLTPNA